MSSNAISSPALAQAVQSLSGKIQTLKQEIKYLEGDLANQGEEHQPKNGSTGGDGVDLESDLMGMEAEIEILKRTIPDGNSDDSTVNFFLAVAELNRVNEGLQQQLRLTLKNIQAAKLDIDASNSWIAELEQLQDKIQHLPKGLNQNGGANQAGSSQSEAKAFDHKIRSTKILLKDCKVFLAKYLSAVAESKKDEAEQNDQSLPMLLQALLDKFQEGLDGEGEGADDTWLKLSHLEFDVESADVIRLLDAGIIEKDPEDHEKIRMINFGLD